MSVSKIASGSSSLKEVGKSDLGLRINSDPNLEMTGKMNLKGNERKISMTLRSEKKDSDGPSQHDCVDAEGVERGGPIETKTPELNKRHPVENERSGEGSDIEVENDDMEDENGPAASYYSILFNYCIILFENNSVFD